MVYIIQNQITQVPVVASRNNPDNSADFYLWNMEHKLTGQVWNFIPYKVPPTTTYKPGYDLFCVGVDDSVPQRLTGNTQCTGVTGTTNVHLIPGEYYLRIYSQSSPSNLNPLQAEYQVYDTQALMVGINQNIPITYSGNSDIFIVYNEDND
jgi:hypothetical protein